MNTGNQAAPATAQPQRDWWVVCFCAQWCGVCREFRTAFDTLARERPQLRLAWVDVEDDEEVVGDLDVETFPTVLVAEGGQVRFFGPVQPQTGMLARLIDGLLGAPGAQLPDEATQALLQRVLDSR